MQFQFFSIFSWIVSVSTILFLNSCSSPTTNKYLAWNNLYWGDNYDKILANFEGEYKLVIDANSLFYYANCPTSLPEGMDCKVYNIPEYQIGEKLFNVYLILKEDKLTRIIINCKSESESFKYAAECSSQTIPVLIEKYGEPVDEKQIENKMKDHFAPSGKYIMGGTTTKTIKEWKTESSYIKTDYLSTTIPTKTSSFSVYYEPNNENVKLQFDSTQDLKDNL
ncbi:hypothetical protein [Cyanobacterium aponinum]|uniref:Uncharacterized protein n=1 Tax=Cyanobacterium aponinum 0216 TaxID=2676140 RepID=A0A844GTU6_9CHRO|nr:hypothetical protein [Cyanobacterium aponinum]MTF37496.1 hypothetical protein [Cyanobacterium aponinum 0216]